MESVDVDVSVSPITYNDQNRYFINVNIRYDVLVMLIYSVPFQ